MKTILRSIAIYLFALYFLPQIIPGLEINGGTTTLFIGATTLALMFLIIKPILTIISFPINIVTMGLFSIFINAFILYLLTVVVTDITVKPFTYERFNIAGFITPVIDFNTFFAYVFTAFVLAAINAIIRWLIE
ncbi:MAG: phage holin family protein [Candidatus Levybacteria bacterium]|nr:phage holin family protein [Candidatus Levybacteria bacterium]